jgi:RNA polymerase sigma factor (sigma-70 family)
MLLFSGYFSKIFSNHAKDFAFLIRIIGEGLQESSQVKEVSIIIDEKTAERLVNTYADMVLRISCMYLNSSADAEDICQEVFLKLVTGDRTFESPEHEKAWIIRATVNACRDSFRTSFLKKCVDLEKAGEIAAPENESSEVLELIGSLPRKYRISIYLHYYEGYQVQEIASMMGKSPAAVSAYLTRGRKALKELIEKDPERMR